MVPEMFQPLKFVYIWYFRRLICVYTVCQCPFYGTPVLNLLQSSAKFCLEHGHLDDDDEDEDNDDDDDDDDDDNFVFFAFR